jgi:rod shape-determining protein MreC
VLRRNDFSRHTDVLVLCLYLLVSAVSLGLSSRSFTFDIKEIGLTFFSFFQGGLASASQFVAETANSVKELAELRDEYAAALDKLKYYERIEKDFNILDQENRRLRDLLRFSQSLQYSNIPARIIGKDPDNSASTLVIDKGSLAGVERNMPVVAIQNGQQGLVGKVITSGLNSSIILPVYDRNSHVAARLLASRYEGLVSGKETDASLLSMRYIKKTAKSEIHYGDMVISSGMNSVYPIGIYIGTVRTVLSKDYETSMELDVEPVVDFSRLEHVFIVKVEG